MKKYRSSIKIISFLVVIFCFRDAEAGWKWIHPLPQGIGMEDTFAFESGEIVSIGFSTVLLRSGDEWIDMSQGIPYETFEGIWCNSLDSIYIVGVNGTIMHYDGEYWMPLESGTSEALRDVWGFAEDEVFAVGDNGVIIYWDGHAWSAMNGGTNSDLQGVWGAAPDDVFAVGDEGEIIHWDGVEWTQSAVFPDYEILTVWGLSSEEVYALGRVSLSGPGVILHWDGDFWTALHYFDEALTDIWGDSPDNIYVSTMYEPGAIRRWDGSDWTEIYSVEDYWFYSLTGTSEDDICAVGIYGHIAQWDGERWSEQSERFKGGAHSIVGLDSDSLAVLTSEKLAYGRWLYLLKFYDGDWTSVEIYEDSEETFHGNEICMWASSRDDFYIGSEGGVILHWDGENSTLMDTGTTRWIRSIWGSSPTDIYAAARTNLLHYDGSEWTPVDTGSATVSSYFDVWGTADDDVWVTGYSRAIHWDGNEWTEHELNIDGDIPRMWGLSSNNVFVSTLSVIAVGHFFYYKMELSHWDGNEWTAVDVPGLHDAFHQCDIYATDVDEIFMFQDYDLKYWNGFYWRPMNVPCASILPRDEYGRVLALGSCGDCVAILSFDGISSRDVVIEMPEAVHPGEDFFINGYLVNDYEILKEARVFFVLEINGEFWFWDDWSQFTPPDEGEVDYVIMDVYPGTTKIEVVESFQWPDTGEQSMSGIRIYGAMVNQDMSHIKGNLSVEEFSFGP